jgi:ABC-type multidrug transport system fused ATPase/permease subunit
MYESLPRRFFRSKVLVLDEATASVDKKTDGLIRMTLARMQGVTMLAIAHRLDTIMDYDRVAVIENGIVAECGNPRVLSRQKGLSINDPCHTHVPSHALHRPY